MYLNFFKHLFKYTIHEPLLDSQKKLVADYLRTAGFYSYDAADEGDDPVKRWIGREVKRFLHEADFHLPFLLRLASGRIDLAEGADGLNAAGEEEMDIAGSAFAPTAEEIESEAQEPTLLRQISTYWDNFLEWTRDIEMAWTADSDSYRQQRALSYCNRARQCSRDLLALKPTMLSWVPHIACNVVPRQIADMGDPTKRAADACESFGACCKRIIKHLTCRRERSAKFGRGYIEQAFRRVTVRASLLHGPENAPFLQRKDHKLLGTGRQSDSPSKVYGPACSIRVKVEQELANA